MFGEQLEGQCGLSQVSKRESGGPRVRSCKSLLSLEGTSASPPQNEWHPLESSELKNDIMQPMFKRVTPATLPLRTEGVRARVKGRR